MRPTLLARFAALILAASATAAAQGTPSASDRTAAWLLYQAVPGVSWTVRPADAHAALEWEFTPVLRSFGLTKLASPWKFFIVEPPARFTGSVELVTSARVFFHRVDRSFWGFSAGLIGHIPLVEYGEYLTFDPGVVRHWIAGRPSDFVSGGCSSVFGFLEYNIQYSPRDRIWVHEIALRMF